MAEARRRGLVGAVRRELGEARHAARALQAAAAAARAAAVNQLTAVRQTEPTRLSDLALARDVAVGMAEQRWQREADAFARALHRLSEQAAPGLAGSPWTAWRADVRPEADASVTPGLLRIGWIDAALARGGPTPEPSAPATEQPPSDQPAADQPPADRPPTDDPLPALMPLLDSAHLNLLGEDHRAADGIISGLLLRALAGVPAGALRITVYDPGQLGGALAGFAPLVPAELVSYRGPGGLGPLLDDLAEQIRRINENVLGGSYRSLAGLAATTGRRPEPWRIAVLLADNPDDITNGQRAQLERIARTGVAAGVHLICRGIELPNHPAVESINLLGDGRVRTTLTGDLVVRPDAPPAPSLVTGVCKALAERVTAGPPPVPFAALLPETLWTQSSAQALRAPIGEGTDGRLVELVLGDDPPHALIGGPSGSGKTNLIYAWLAALATRYGPDDLALYLLDFKEGVSFARFAPGLRDPSWLPQVRLVGVNVNADREFGLALLRNLAEELKRRAAAAKQHEVSKLAELRAEDPQGHWPRIVAVIDEFQVLLGARDPVTTEAVNLLEDLARRGRSQGIHLILASQDVAGIEALWGRSGLVAQFTLRVALPKARRILADTNLAAELIPRCHAVVNADSGVPSANTIVRLPDCGDRNTWLRLQEQLWRSRPTGNEPPILFDGDVRPLFPVLPAAPAPEALAQAGAVALLGQTIDVNRRPAVLRLNRAPGRNLAVIGSRADDACSVLSAAALALGRQHRPGSARFSVLCLDDDAMVTAKALLAKLPEATWHDRDNVLALLRELTENCDGMPHYVFGFAVDAAASLLASRPAPGMPTGHELLRAVLAKGPERRTHLLCWWRTAARLRDDLGGVGARLDAIGAWVALDVHGPELAPLYPQPGGPAWHPRLHRALHFDRAVHHKAEIIMPYEVML